MADLWIAILRDIRSSGLEPSKQQVAENDHSDGFRNVRAFPLGPTRSSLASLPALIGSEAILLSFAGDRSVGGLVA